jgi:phage tail-like protein
MRGTISRLPTPHPLAPQLPPALQEDGFTQAFVAGLDEVLAPVLACLDNLEAYIDPMLAPEDFLGWLALWMGAELDETWPLERRRRLVATAIDLYRRRGTAAGLRAQLEVCTGATVDIAESGGVAWSQTHGGALPGEPVPRLAVRVTFDGDTAVSQRAVEALVAGAKPAHVLHHLEVVTG